MKIDETDIHHHLKYRMSQRGISKEEIENTFNKGWPADDAKEGVKGKVFVFSYNSYWEGKYYEEKEITVYYKIKEDKVIFLTAEARYGKTFIKGG